MSFLSFLGFYSKKKVNDIYIQDASIQYYVLSGCGLNVWKLCLGPPGAENAKKNGRS
jgi:hypothetical protein